VRRRGSSLSSNPGYNNQQQLMDEDRPDIWTIECGEPAVWTIVGIDINRHTFYIPPILANGHSPSSTSTPASIAPIFNTPIPSIPIGPQIPFLLKWIRPTLQLTDIRQTQTQSPHPSEDPNMLTFYGENFTPTLQIWFGDQPSLRAEKLCKEVIRAVPPTAFLGAGIRTPVLLVRNDGVIFPTNIIYSS